MVTDMNAVSMKDCNSQSLRDAAFTYHGMGYKILSLKPQSKEVESPGWSNPEYQDDPIHWESPGCMNNNIGMPLGRNRFFIIDIDCKPAYVQTIGAIADALVEATGVDELFWESETIGISSGREGSEKYLFRIPAGFETCMKYRRINRYTKERVCHSVVEFRCGNGFQDVMPPSIHPSGTTYQFVGGDEVLDMPYDLLYLACNWQLFIDRMLSANPDQIKPEPVRNRFGNVYAGEDYAQIWCEKESLADWLVSSGYTSMGSNRYLSPHSTTGSPGIVVFDGGRKFWSHGASDPFCDGHPHDAYDLLVHCRYGGSYKEAWKYVLTDLGIKNKRITRESGAWH